MRSTPPSGPTDASADANLTQQPSDAALEALLQRLKAAVDPSEIRQLSDRIERLIFHKQFEDA